MSAEGMQVLPEGLRDGLMSMKMISLLCHGVESHQISNYQNTCGRYWTSTLAGI